MNANPQSPLTVYYDGACPVCRREIGYYQGRTGEAVAYCDVAATVDPAPDLTREYALKRFHVRLADGQLVSGAAAFLALWGQVPGFSRIASLLSVKPVVAMLDVAYLGFLRLRKLWR
jgi:predicted DCC family thiol-disulfide oxidoreductase YuxK